MLRRFCVCAAFVVGVFSVLATTPTSALAPDCTNESCDDLCAELEDALRAPAPAPGEVVAECEVGNAETPSRCTCDDDAGEVNRSITTDGDGPGCAVLGRTDCLVENVRFRGCTLEDSSSCVETCELVRQVIAEDNARSFNAELRRSSCRDHCECRVDFDDDDDGAADRCRVYRDDSRFPSRESCD